MTDRLVLERREKLVALARGWEGPQGVRAKPAPKKPVGIEQLLRWAYRDELPKMGALARGPAEYARPWSQIERMGEELSLALDDNRYGVVPDFSAQSLPHQDAIAVHEAVMRLDDLDLVVPEDWNPIEEMGDLEGLARPAIARALDAETLTGRDGKRRLRQTPRRLVFKHAILGGTPEWEIVLPQVCPVTERGQVKYFRRVVTWLDGLTGPVQHEIEVDGYNSKAKMPYGDAYTKQLLEPDPHLGLIGRAEYEVWHAALGVIAADLAGMLDEREVVPCERPARPWETAFAEAEPRILRDLTQPALVSAARRVGTRQRPRAMAGKRSAGKA